MSRKITPHRRPVHSARMFAAAVVGWVGAVDAGGCWLYLQTPDHQPVLLALLVCDSLIAAAVGLLIVWRYPRHVVGWLLIAHGALVAPVLASDGYAEYGGVIHPGSLPAPQWVAAFGNASWPLLYLCLALIGYVFPDGRFLTRRWRRFAAGCAAGYALFIAAGLFGIKRFPGRLSPLHPPLPRLSGAVTGPLTLVGMLCIAGSLVGAAVCARRRFARADADDRLKMLWVAAAALTIPGGLALCLIDQWLTGGAGTLTVVAVTAFGTAVPLAIGMAILQHRLFDIELVLSRTLTYGTLTVLIVGVYAGLLTGLGRLFDSRTAAGLVAVAVVAAVVQPVHSRLHRRVERWVYGDRSDPYAAIRRLSDRLAGTVEPSEVLSIVTTSVAEALRVETVSIALDRSSEFASNATDEATELGCRHRIPLCHQGNRLGDLVIDPPPGRELNPSDRRMAQELARHAAVIVNAVHLTLDLQHSRARLVTAREEERRRLRRDLHDGLGPSLAAMVLKLNVLSGTVADSSARALLTQVRTETKAAIAEIRRVVDDLRPPALDEVGLLGALRHKAAAICGPDSANPLVVEIDGPAQTPPLPAAVEVAAYRIATEALTNVIRHAAATRCTVTIAINGALDICVSDNGTGSPSVRQPGVGWASMNERAAELGGSCSITRRPDGGTTVQAVLPLPLAHDMSQPPEPLSLARLP